jgi:LmbE family N-acetylglucosaminyl deacetylase
MTTLVVVAHPDDETIWFGPTLEEADLIVAALPRHPRSEELTAAREAVQREFPFRMEFLPIDGAAVFRQSDRMKPKLAPYGVELLETCPADVRERYIGNYDKLLATLDPYVAGASEIYSHNPWGEYGHEAHIQVWSAVSRLAERHGRSVWVWDGFSNENLLARGVRTRLEHYTPLPDDLRVREFQVNIEMYERLKALYTSHGAWTWADIDDPPSSFRYLEAVREGSRLLGSE